MTAFLYISYSSGLTQSDELAIDVSVLENRTAITNFVRKVGGKARIRVISSGLAILILVSAPKNSKAIGLPLTPPASIMVMRHSAEIVPSYTRLIAERQNTITLLKNGRVPQSDQIYSDLSENRSSSVDEALDLRGGDMAPLTEILFRLLMIWAMGQGHMPTSGFQPGQVNRNFGHHSAQGGPSPRLAPKLQENPLDRNNPGQGPSKAINSQDGILTKSQRRNLPSPDDIVISEQNVVIRHGQARYKIKDHGHAFGIESTQNSKGKFKTERTPENIQAFKKEIEALVLNGKRIEGTYRKTEPDGYPATHFYDKETGRNVIFKNDTNEFVSGWTLNENQRIDLLTNGNVGDY